MKLTREEVQKILDICADDGHGIASPGEFTGVNPEFIKSVTHTHQSDRSDPRYTISVGNKTVDRFTGVHTLEALKAACLNLGLTADANYFGRGRNARAYTDALRAWLRGER